MSNASDFIIESGVLTKYVGPGGDVVIPEGVTEISDAAFCKVSKIGGYTVVDPVCEIHSIAFPTGLKKIGAQALFGHEKLTRVSLPDTLKTIENKAFWGCGLESVLLPKSVTKIGEEAFSRNPLQRVAIAGKAKVGRNAFSTGMTWTEYLSGKGTANFELPEELASLPLFLDWDELYDKASFIHNVLRGDFPMRTADIRYVLSRLMAARKTLLPEIAAGLTLPELKAMEEHGAITAENADRLLELLADNVACKTELLGYIHKSITLEQRDTVQEKAVERTVEKIVKRGRVLDDSLAAFEKQKPADVKKQWKCISQEDGLLIEKYNGIETAIVIPAVIGGKSVIALADEAMRASAKGEDGKKNAYNKKMYKIKAVIVMAGIHRIGAAAFDGCAYMTDICLPSSITDIGPEAFHGCHKLTIHAPAGSYAEAYAKENNIPFVTE